MEIEESYTKYPGQTAGEVTQLVVRKHIMAIAPILFAMAILVFIFILGIIVLNQNQKSIESFLPSSVVELIGFLVLFVIVLLTIGTIWIWRRNKVVLTNQHIVDVDQIGLFNRSVSTLRLEEIQDITASTNGLLQHLFGYGTIIIQTAGERENFVFDFVPNPYTVEHKILETRKKYFK